MNLSDEHAGMDEMGDWWDSQTHKRPSTNLDNTMSEETKFIKKAHLTEECMAAFNDLMSREGWLAGIGTVGANADVRYYVDVYGYWPIFDNPSRPVGSASHWGDSWRSLQFTGDTCLAALNAALAQRDMCDRQLVVRSETYQDPFATDVSAARDLILSMYATTTVDLDDRRQYLLQFIVAVLTDLRVVEVEKSKVVWPVDASPKMDSDVARHDNLRDRIGQVINDKLAALAGIEIGANDKVTYIGAFDTDFIDDMADGVIEQLKAQFNSTVGKEQITDAIHSNSITSAGYDKDGKRVFSYSRSTSDANGDHRVMDAALELVQAIKLRQVPISALDLYKHLVGATDARTAYPVECMAAIDELRLQEGWSVSIICDNPDFGMGRCNMVEVYGEWMATDGPRKGRVDWCAVQFTGDSLLQALQTAVIGKKLNFEAMEAASKTP